MSDFDENIRRALEDDEAFKGLMAQLREAAVSEVNVRDDTPCANPKCNCKHVRMVKVPDYKTKLAIAEFLANRGVGRPNATETANEEQIQFERVVYLTDLKDHEKGDPYLDDPEDTLNRAWLALENDKKRAWIEARSLGFLVPKPAA